MNAILLARFRSVFGRDPDFMARAPGRIEFIGNHTDYNAGTVLGASIDRGVWVALARRTDHLRRFATDRSPAVIELPATAIEPQKGDLAWVNYPLGVLAALPQFGLPVLGGFEYLAMADLPAGAGLSSSAAIELASALVFLEAVGSHPDRATVVKAARYAENNFVGVPCGILDQGVSGFGRKDHLVFIDCRGPRFETVPLPANAHFWVFNTHTKHALVDGLYAARHRECMEAAKTLGVKLLADASVAQVEQASAILTPPAFRRARHVVEEIARVDRAVQALTVGDLAAVGKLLTASHRSSQKFFENSTPELDLLVDSLEHAPHVFGARLSGGGFGGAVMALTDGAFGQADAVKIADVYEKAYGARPDILHMQTSDGASLV